MTTSSTDMANVDVADGANPLTFGGTDSLFTLTLKSAPASFDPANLLVSAGAAGQTATAVNFQLVDTNGNGKLDVGESLSCVEPGVNLFDPTSVGKTFDVALGNRENGMLIERAHATWAPLH